MAYATTNPPQALVPGMGGAPTLWIYKSADIHTDVDVAGYFTNGAALGMKAHDVMIVIDTGNGVTIHRVSSATTIAAAVLA